MGLPSYFTTAVTGGYDCIPRLRELAMKRQVGGLISFSLLTIITGGCQPDAPIGLPVLAGRVEPKPPNVLRDGIAFFTREFSASGGVAIMQPDGSGRQPLAGAEAGFEPAISPNGRRIAFSRNTDIGVTAIYIMDVDDGVATPIVGGLTLNPTPVWSPDGCQIAFRSVLETSGGPSGRISIINADGTGLRQVTPEPGPLDFAFDEGPTWSPDGTRLAFTRNSVLHVINVDGTGMTALPNEDMAGTPSWSPDGERIAYVSLEPNRRHSRPKCGWLESRGTHDQSGVRKLAPLVGRWQPAGHFARDR